MKKAFIMMGPSGGGKSTWLALAGVGLRAHCSADNYFLNSEGEYNFDPTKLGEAHDRCLREFIHACVKGASTVVCDNTNTSMGEVSPYLAVAKAFGYEVRVILCDGGHDNSHGVPEATVLRQRVRLVELITEWPSWWPQPEVQS